MASRISTPAVSEATGETAALFADIRKAAGGVPAAYAAIGALNPAALRAILGADAVLSAGSLSRAEQEAIKLAVSAGAGCDYCVAAHSLLGKRAGIAQDDLRRIRDGAPTGDARRDALAALARRLQAEPGSIPEAAFAELRAAGITDAEIVDVALAVAVIGFTNVFNRVNDTTIDFPAVA
ncbi:peroxidase-related enzyme [Paroceanicella profunda]|uniref:Peroxidase-related enzyme n=1 Tax=Paroceanicella profunda TaxID=2579971 RepID=A0A5B8FGE1_9RHOB|nr:peroxidase-related enzyme [Paroceanicella profunda]QDL90748.1 peroxidase-related enzyme [Paroceanicella profunda]